MLEPEPARVVYNDEACLWRSSKLEQGNYAFRVRAKNHQGAGEWSETATLLLDASQHANAREQIVVDAQRELRRQTQAELRRDMRALVTDHQLLTQMGRLNSPQALTAAFATDAV